MLIPTDVKLEKVVLEQIGRQEALGQVLIDLGVYSFVTLKFFL